MAVSAISLLHDMPVRILARGSISLKLFYWNHQDVVSVSPQKCYATLPEGFSIYSWIDIACFHSRDGTPFSLANWDRHSVDGFIQQLEWSRATGARGVFMHTLYHFTGCDSGGESIGGYGVLPRRQYLDAIRRWQGH